MKTFLFLSMLSTLILLPFAEVQAAKPYLSTQELKREIAGMLKNRDLHFLEKEVEMVNVEFLINAKNELVILAVKGENETTCDHIRNILGFQRVNYQQPRQLMRYKVDLRLVKSGETSSVSRQA